MRIATPAGVIDTHRTTRPGPGYDMVIVEDRFQLHRHGENIVDRGMATATFTRQVIEHHPEIVDETIGREIVRMIDRREVEPQAGPVPAPGIHPGGVLPPAELRAQYRDNYFRDNLDAGLLADRIQENIRNHARDVAAQENVPAQGYAEFRGNWTATNAPLRYTWTPGDQGPAEIRIAPIAGAAQAVEAAGEAMGALTRLREQFERVQLGATQNGEEVKKMATKIKQECACGSPDDENWEHAHDECTFLDRPSSEWVDEGHA